jgi:hypothetical protein
VEQQEPSQGSGCCAAAQRVHCKARCHYVPEHKIFLAIDSGTHLHKLITAATVADYVFAAMPVYRAGVWDDRQNNRVTYDVTPQRNAGRQAGLTSSSSTTQSGVQQQQ